MTRPPTIDHAHDERVQLAAMWLVSTPREEIPGSIIATIRERFGLSAQEACEACATAARIREASHADAS